MENPVVQVPLELNVSAVPLAIHHHSGVPCTSVISHAPTMVSLSNCRFGSSSLSQDTKAIVATISEKNKNNFFMIKCIFIMKHVSYLLKTSVGVQDSNLRLSLTTVIHPHLIILRIRGLMQDCHFHRVQRFDAP